jgi:hypothetical protein
MSMSADLPDEYAAVKRLVGATATGLDDYGRGKNAVVQTILAAAGLTEADPSVHRREQRPCRT